MLIIAQTHVFPRLALVRRPWRRGPARSSSRPSNGGAGQRREVQLVQHLRRRVFFAASSLPRRLFGLRSFSLTVGPLMSCSAWARLLSLSRSHSQASSRAGWPNVFRNGWFTSPSGSWIARVPAAGRRTSPAPPVTSQIASSSCSAVSSFVTACEKYLLSSLFEVVRLRAELVRPRVHDRPDQVLHVELVRDEVLRQRVEQFVVARRVRVAEVVHRIDDALAHQVEPDAVDDRLGEERVVGAGQPRRRAPRGGPRPASRRRRRRRCNCGVISLPVRGCVTSPSRTREHDLGGGRVARRLRADDRLGLGLHAGEERGHAVVVVLRPALERVVVALRALHPDAEEQLGRRLGQALSGPGRCGSSSPAGWRRCCRWR